MDDRVATALSHWSGRMLANGVPFSDWRAAQDEISDWSRWCAFWLDRAHAHAALADDAAARGRTRSAGEHWTRAAACAHFGKFLFFDDLDLAARAATFAVTCRNSALPHLDPPGERLEIPYEGTVLPGNLRLPRGAERPPLVVMAMGLDSAKEEMHHHEQDFLTRGLATFSFDGPGQGEVERHLAIEAAYEKPIAAVLDVLCADPRLDDERVALWGVSLGGYYAPRAAAFDARVAACVSLSGPFDFSDGWERLPELTRNAFRVRTHSADADSARRRAADLDLDGVAQRIRCPLLVISGGQDRLFGPQHARRLVDAAGGPVDHLDVPEGGHVVNNVPHRYRPYSADWLMERLHAAAS